MRLLARPGKKETGDRKERREANTVRYGRTSSPLAPLMGKAIAEPQGDMERDMSVAATSRPAPFDHNSPVRGQAQTEQ